MKPLRLALAACIVWVMPTTAGAAAQSEANRSPQLFRQHCKFDPTGASQYCAAECGSGYQFANKDVRPADRTMSLPSSARR